MLALVVVLNVRLAMVLNQTAAMPAIADQVWKKLASLAIKPCRNVPADAHFSNTGNV